jgi:hypothetical protein
MNWKFWQRKKKVEVKTLLPSYDVEFLTDTYIASTVMHITLTAPIYNAFIDDYLPAGLEVVVPVTRKLFDPEDAPMPERFESKVVYRECNPLSPIDTTQTVYYFEGAYLCWGPLCPGRNRDTNCKVLTSRVEDRSDVKRLCYAALFECFGDRNLDKGTYPTSNSLEELALLFVIRLESIKLYPPNKRLGTRDYGTAINRRLRRNAQNSSSREE